MPLSRRRAVVVAGAAALAAAAATGTAAWQFAQGHQPTSSTLAPSAQGASATPHEPDEPGGETLLRAGARVLFQGDSVTDARRDRADLRPNTPQGLGEGYAWLVTGAALAERPDDGLQFFNRGLSGNVTADLLARWDQDTIALAPDVVSVLVGINDYWNRHRISGYVGSPDTYHFELAQLITRTREALPGAAMVICEPFVLPAGPVTPVWVREFADYQQAAADLAQVHGLRLVGFQAALDEALEREPATHWLYDGVHPTAEGAQLLAREWARALR
ncbi:SGNH/GDSL hydrolase family protein [Propionibacteriaceae bacterium Y1923]